VCGNGSEDPSDNNELAALRAEVARLRKALSQLLRVIEHDELIPESMSYMQQARKALTLPKTQETP
jgi:hypothetical protein